MYRSSWVSGLPMKFALNQMVFDCLTKYRGPRRHGLLGSHDGVASVMDDSDINLDLLSLRNQHFSNFGRKKISNFDHGIVLP